MANPKGGSPPLRVTFAVPRSELDRARGELKRLWARQEKVPVDFDRQQLRGEVTLEIDAPFARDPLLDRLVQKGVVSTSGPMVVTLPQPVGYVVGQLAGAMVLALHGEGDFTIPLSGGRGAITVGHEAGQFHLGVPLSSYAGVAAIPQEPAARAVAAACGALAAILDEAPESGMWPLVAFLRRQRAILDRDGSEMSRQNALPSAVSWRPADYAVGLESPLDVLGQLLEARNGAHVVPYWAAKRGMGGVVQFEPLRRPGTADRAGAAAFGIFPDKARPIEVSLPEDPAGEAKLRNRLRRRAPFSATFAEGRLTRVVESTSELPMA